MKLFKQWILFFGIALFAFWFFQQRGVGIGDTALPTSWSEDFTVASAGAKAEAKPMLLAFSASWCGPCKSMKARVYPHAKVEAELANWVPVYIDGDKQREVLNQFQIKSYPTYVVLNPDGKVAMAWAGGTTVNSFVGKLKQAAATWATPAAAGS